MAQGTGPAIQMSKADRQTCELLIKELMHKKGCSYKQAHDEIMKNWGMGGPSTGNDTGMGFGMRPRQELPDNDVKKALPDGWLDLSQDPLTKARQMVEGQIGVLGDGTVVILEEGQLTKAGPQSNRWGDIAAAQQQQQAGPRTTPGAAWTGAAPPRPASPPMGGGFSNPTAGFAKPAAPAAPAAPVKPAVTPDDATQHVPIQDTKQMADLARFRARDAAATSRDQQQAKRSQMTPAQENIQQVKDWHSNIRSMGLEPPPMGSAKHHGTPDWTAYHNRVHNRAHKFAEGFPPRRGQGELAFSQWHGSYRGRHAEDDYEHVTTRGYHHLAPGGDGAHIGSPDHHDAIDAAKKKAAARNRPSKRGAQVRAAADASVEKQRADYRAARRAGTPHSELTPVQTTEEAIHTAAHRASRNPFHAAAGAAARMTGRGNRTTNPVSQSELAEAAARHKPIIKSESAMTEFEALGWVDLGEDNIRKSLAMEVGQIGLMPNDVIVCKGEDGLMHPWEPGDDEFVPDWVVWMYPSDLEKGFRPEDMHNWLYKAGDDPPVPPPDPAPGPTPAPAPAVNRGSGAAHFKQREEGKKATQAAGLLAAMRSAPRAAVRGVREAAQTVSAGVRGARAARPRAAAEGDRKPGLAGRLAGRLEPLTAPFREGHRAASKRRRSIRGARAAAEGDVAPRTMGPSATGQSDYQRGQQQKRTTVRERPWPVAGPGARMTHAVGEVLGGKRGRERRAAEVQNMREHHDNLTHQIQEHPAWLAGFRPRHAGEKEAANHFRTKLRSARGQGQRSGGIHEHRSVRDHTEQSIRHHETLHGAMDEFMANLDRKQPFHHNERAQQAAIGKIGLAHGVLHSNRATRNLPGMEHIRAVTNAQHISPHEAAHAAATIRRHLKTQHGHDNRQVLQEAHNLLHQHSTKGREHLSRTAKGSNPAARDFLNRMEREHVRQARERGHDLPLTMNEKRTQDADREHRKAEQKAEKRERKQESSEKAALHATKRALMAEHGHVPENRRAIERMDDLLHAVHALGHKSKWPKEVHHHFRNYGGAPQTIGEAPEHVDHKTRADELERKLAELTAEHARLQQTHEGAMGALHGPRPHVDSDLRRSVPHSKSEIIEQWGWTDLIEDTIQKAHAVPEGGVAVMPDGQIVIKEAGYFQPWFPRHPDHIPPWAMYLDDPSLFKSGPDYHGAPTAPQGRWVVRTSDPELEIIKAEAPPPPAGIQIGSLTYINSPAYEAKPEGSRVGLDPITAPPGVYQD